MKTELTKMTSLTVNGTRVVKGDKVNDGVKWVELTGWRIGDEVEVKTERGEYEYPNRKQLSK